MRADVVTMLKAILWEPAFDMCMTMEAVRNPLAV